MVKDKSEPVTFGSDLSIQLYASHLKIQFTI